MKIIKTFIAIVLIAGLAVMVNVGLEEEGLVTAENPFGLAGVGIRPDGEKLTNIDMSKDEIELAYQLYTIACQNDKNAEYRACYSICPTSNLAVNMDNKILLNILEIKNKEEFYRIDYRIKDDVPLFNAMPALEVLINRFLQIVTTERRYASLSQGYSQYQLTLNATTNDDGAPYANWSKILEDLTEELPIFHPSQEEEYEKSAHIIALDTIQSASVTYDEAKGIYSVTVSLDVFSIDPVLGVNKATLKTRPIIQEGADAEDAHYTELEISFDLWDNGYFKDFHSKEHWRATTVANLAVVCTFVYHDRYSYKEADCDISKYYNNGFINDYQNGVL